MARVYSNRFELIQPRSLATFIFLEISTGAACLPLLRLSHKKKSHSGMTLL